MPRRLVHRINDDVDLTNAALVEPMAVVWRALTRIPIRRGLTVAVVGDGTVVEITPDELVNNDLGVRGSFSFAHSPWAQVVEMVNEGSLDGSFLVTHRFSIDQSLNAPDALRGVAEPAGPRGKVAVTL